MTKTVIITQGRTRGTHKVFDPLAPHSEWAKVVRTTIEGRNILRMEHEDSVSMVVLGEGFTVSTIEDTAS